MQWNIKLILKSTIKKNIKLCKKNYININITKWVKQANMKQISMEI